MRDAEEQKEGTACQYLKEVNLRIVR